jgi:S1-C subfamily serine protease
LNAFDVFMLGLFVAAAYGGYRLGFVARLSSWIGMAIGLVLAARLVPVVLENVSGPDDPNRLMIAAVVLVFGTFFGQALGLVVGSRLRLALPVGPARMADRSAGAVAGVVGVVVIVWLLLPAMASIPDWPAREARNSAIARSIDDLLPPPPDALLALRSLFGSDAFPQVFDALRPAPDLGPPPADSGLSQDVADAVARSTVRVEGVACDQIQDGSGSVVAPELVVTNAHVVAGERDTRVERHPDGAMLPATVVAFDPDRDVAVLRVPGIDRPPLPIGNPQVGGIGGEFGHPGGGPLRIAPFAIGDDTTVTGTDIYDAQRTERDVLFLSASLRPGDSGAPLVTPDGSVVGVAFAIAPDRAGVAYGLAPSEIHPVLDPVVAAAASAAVDTGSCLR